MSMRAKPLDVSDGLWERIEPGPARKQAPAPGRREGPAARLDAARRQPQRRHATARAARSGAAGPRPLRPTAETTACAARRSRLRPRQVPPAALAARDQAADRQTPERARLRARPRPLGGRAHLRLAPQPPPTAPTHRPPRRHPRELPRPRLLPHLLAKAGDLIELELLRERVEACAERPRFGRLVNITFTEQQLRAPALIERRA